MTARRRALELAAAHADRLADRYATAAAERVDEATRAIYLEQARIHTSQATSLRQALTGRYTPADDRPRLAAAAA